MNKFRVKTGTHYIGDKMYRTGDVFEHGFDKLHQTEGGRFFENLGDMPVEPAILPVADKPTSDKVVPPKSAPRKTRRGSAKRSQK